MGCTSRATHASYKCARAVASHTSWVAPSHATHASYHMCDDSYVWKQWPTAFCPFAVKRLAKHLEHTTRPSSATRAWLCAMEAQSGDAWATEWMHEPQRGMHESQSRCWALSLSYGAHEPQSGCIICTLESPDCVTHSYHAPLSCTCIVHFVAHCICTTHRTMHRIAHCVTHSYHAPDPALYLHHAPKHKYRVMHYQW